MLVCRDMGLTYDRDFLQMYKIIPENVVIEYVDLHT